MVGTKGFRGKLLLILLVVSSLGFANCLTPVRYADVEEIFQKKCAVCHKGPWLDLQTFPFAYDAFPDTQKQQSEMVQEFIRRMRLPESDWDRMPTRNAKPIEESEILKIEAWFKDGLQP